MENIDEVWMKASERFPTSTTAWLKNFAGDLNRAKDAIADALKERNILRYQLNRDNSSSSNCSVESDEAVALLRLVTEHSQMTAVISSVLNNRCNADKNSLSRDNHILHVAAKTGCIADLRRVIKRNCVDVLNSDEETPLHLAAEFEHVDDVRILLEHGLSLIHI